MCLELIKMFGFCVVLIGIAEGSFLSRGSLHTLKPSQEDVCEKPLVEAELKSKSKSAAKDLQKLKSTTEPYRVRKYNDKGVPNTFSNVSKRTTEPYRVRKYNDKGAPNTFSNLSQRKARTTPLLQFWKGIFINRNNVEMESGTLKNHINFTAETLEYATPGNRANEITQNLIDAYHSKFEAESKGRFLLVEVCAGIGGNTLSFLESHLTEGSIGGLRSYEADEDRRRMLLNNVEVFGLQWEGFRLRGSFDSSEKLPVGTAVYMDPPWLPKDVNVLAKENREEEKYKKSYYTRDIKVGEKTLEEWMEHYSESVYILGAQIPLDAKVKTPTNWEVATSEILYSGAGKKKSQLVVFRNKSLNVESVKAAGFGLKGETFEKL